MTSMIDVVPAVGVLPVDVQDRRPEGDFNVKCPPRPPLGHARPSNSSDQGPHSGNADRLDREHPLCRCVRPESCGLGKRIRGVVGVPRARPWNTEVEFDCDYNLRYEYVIQAITAVRLYRRRARHQVGRKDQIHATAKTGVGKKSRKSLRLRDFCISCQRRPGLAKTAVLGCFGLRSVTNLSQFRRLGFSLPPSSISEFC